MSSHDKQEFKAKKSEVPIDSCKPYFTYIEWFIAEAQTCIPGGWENLPPYIEARLKKTLAEKGLKDDKILQALVKLVKSVFPKVRENIHDPYPLQEAYDRWLVEKTCKEILAPQELSPLSEQRQAAYALLGFSNTRVSLDEVERSFLQKFAKISRDDGLEASDRTKQLENLKAAYRLLNTPF
jgi:hypothetical protein